MKRFLIFAISLFTVAGCNNPTDDPTPDNSATEGSSFIGKLEVTPNEGSRFEAFSADDIEFILTEDTAAEAGSEHDFVNLKMPQIKFVKEMPVWISLELPGLEEMDDIDQAYDFEFGAEEMLPYFMGLPYDPAGDGRYTITRLTGCYLFQEKQLRVEFDCYTMHVTYTGSWVSESAPVEEMLH